mmetsp:Transcript_30051/g.86043  ORF Transcript_30051/g.86043 Transcript_30051/m.86043 type:complete len:299 (+) Transcript_30051:163-1059(+)
MLDIHLGCLGPILVGKLFRERSDLLVLEHLHSDHNALDNMHGSTGEHLLHGLCSLHLHETQAARASASGLGPLPLARRHGGGYDEHPHHSAVGRKVLLQDAVGLVVELADAADDEEASRILVPDRLQALGQRLRRGTRRRLGYAVGCAVGCAVDPHRLGAWSRRRRSRLWWRKQWEDALPEELHVHEERHALLHELLRRPRKLQARRLLHPLHGVEPLCVVHGAAQQPEREVRLPLVQEGRHLEHGGGPLVADAARLLGRLAAGAAGVTELGLTLLKRLRLLWMLRAQIVEAGRGREP